MYRLGRIAGYRRLSIHYGRLSILSLSMLYHIPLQRVVVEQAGRHADVANADVVVASVQTLARADSQRIQKYDPAQFKCIVIDEAHHAAARIYLRALDHFRIRFDASGSRTFLREKRDPSSHIFLWGCSATVLRHDGLKLGALFEEVCTWSEGIPYLDRSHIIKIFGI